MTSASIHQWVAEPLSAEVRRALERLARGADVHTVAVMPDVHLSREVCVGVALATHSTVVPAAVGGDIGCGMATVAFDVAAHDLFSEASVAAAVLERLYEVIPVMRRRRRDGVALPSELATTSLSEPKLEVAKRGEAGLQFGTLGRGNHFLEFQADEADDRLWLVVHSGSRGIGQAIRSVHESRGRRNQAGLRVLDAEAPGGRAYLGDVSWALRYAELSRARMIEAVVQSMRDLFRIEVDSSTALSCHHNFVRKEEHGGRALWVHRKGALSAEIGEPGIIPGSMGAPSFHVEGRGCPASLCSSSHGAGRAMSRHAARRYISKERFEASMQGVWFDHRASSRLVEEAPSAYKDISAVMRAQKALTKICRQLRPVLVFKGS